MAVCHLRSSGLGFFTLASLLLTPFLFAIAAWAAESTNTRSPPPLPDPEVASSGPNAFRIFNAVHSALRQWGSSLHHNGLSFIPVTVPAGNVFYHGRIGKERPSEFDWLAFEIEHAAAFARSWEPPSHRPLKSGPSGDVDFDDQKPLVEGVPPEGQDNRRPSSSRRPSSPSRGYLHTYRAARPLRLVYIDGMAAGKCSLGTLDSQDHVLLDWPLGDGGRPIFNEWERAEGLCSLASDWGIDGWVRMELGFEIIYCNYSAGAGLDLVSTRGSPFRNESSLDWVDSDRSNPIGGRWEMFEWIRTAAARYHGLQPGRVSPDLGGMVSLFSYAVNTTNPDPSRPELPRVLSTTRDERRGIRARLRDVVDRWKAGELGNGIGWQQIVDEIVTRNSGRVRYLAEVANSTDEIRSDLAVLLRPYLDFPADEDVEESHSPATRCRDYFLTPALDRMASWSPEDQAIHAAVSSVSARICDTLFEMREIVSLAVANNTDTSDREAVVRIRELAVELKGDLAWTTWKECGHCADPGQVCFIAMFPSGSEEDHYNPQCRSPEEIGGGYFDWGRPRGDNGGNRP